ncbi:hypothetical protein JCM6882_008292 [Rhodosporidiobolus microsporus]
MCNAQATIFYGLFVRSFDLLCAVDAWDELEPPFRGVALINLRRSKNKLEVNGNARMADVPREIWEAIKHELAGLALETAKQHLLASVRCGDCDARDTKAVDLASALSCDDCREMFTDDRNLDNRFYHRTRTLSAFLATFRLYSPQSRLVTNEPYWLDDDALSAIAFPSSFPHQPLHSEVESSNSAAIVGHEARRFDPALFASIPPSAPGHFRRFVHLFRLEVVNASAFLPGNTVSPDEANSSDVSVDSELGWQFWTSSVCS